VVGFLFASEEAARQASSSLKSDGHDVLAVQPQGGAVRVEVRKAAAPGSGERQAS
jgi:hypothetical protein